MNPNRRAVVVALIVLALRAGAAMGQGSVVAHGGGADWDLGSHREMVRWMINQAAAGHEGDGKVRAVILGAVPRDPEEPDAAAEAFRREGAEVEALVVTGENADAPETAAAIESARIVWIRGGNQWRYVNWWNGTATERAIRRVFEAGGVVGGTSAGCAILGEVAYDARNGSLRPEQALADGRHENLTLTEGFLNVVPGVLFDTHFTERGRIGRLPVMMARAKADFGKEVMGVGVDHETALMIDAQGRGTVVGTGWVTVLLWRADSAAECVSGRPPVVTGVAMTVLPSGAEYDLRQRRAAHYGMATGHLHRISPGTMTEVEVVPTMWARDRGVFDRAKHWLLSLGRQAPCASVLLDEGSSATLVNGRRHDITANAGSHPAAAVVLYAGGGAAVSDQHSPAFAIDNALLHILPPAWGFDRLTGETSAPPADPAAAPLPSSR